jgi:hypothetical protein
MYSEEQRHKAKECVQNSEDSFREVEASACKAEASARLNCAPAARQLRKEIRAGPPMARARNFLENLLCYFASFYRTFLGHAANQYSLQHTRKEKIPTTGFQWFLCVPRSCDPVYNVTW